MLLHAEHSITTGLSHESPPLPQVDLPPENSVPAWQMWRFQAPAGATAGCGRCGPGLWLDTLGYDWDIPWIEQNLTMDLSVNDWN